MSVMMTNWNHGPAIISSSALEDKRSIREPGGNAAPRHEKVLEMLGDDYDRVREEAFRAEVRELKG